MSRQQGGFTLIEVLLSVSIIALLAGLSLPLYAGFQRRNDLSTTSETVANGIRRAQTYAEGSKQDEQWGINVQSTAVVLYKGATYATRDTTLDETITLTGAVTASGVSDINFAKQTGLPNTTGNLTLTASSGETKVITINAKGVVTY